MQKKTKTIDNEWVIKLNYEPEMEYLGEGKFGIVYKTFKKNDPAKKPIAIKISSCENKDDFMDFLKEADNMIKLGWHKNIVQIENHNFQSFPDPFSKKQRYYVQIAMECADISLADLIENRKKKGTCLSWEEFYYMGYDCLSALKHLSSLKIGHLDLKPENILYFNKQNAYKLADWGGALQSRSQQSQTAFFSRAMLITEYYAPPELHKIAATNTFNSKFDLEKADLYSLGVTFLECLGISKKSNSMVEFMIDALKSFSIFRYSRVGNRT